MNIFLKITIPIDHRIDTAKFVKRIQFHAINSTTNASKKKQRRKGFEPYYDITHPSETTYRLPHSPYDSRLSTFHFPLSTFHFPLSTFHLQLTTYDYFPLRLTTISPYDLRLFPLTTYNLRRSPHFTSTCIALRIVGDSRIKKYVPAASFSFSKERLCLPGAILPENICCTLRPEASTRESVSVSFSILSNSTSQRWVMGFGRTLSVADGVGRIRRAPP